MQLLSYFKENPSAIFILDFILLLMFAALLLIYRREREANLVAEYAYFILVAGVLVQLVQYVRENRGEAAQQGAPQ